MICSHRLRGVGASLVGSWGGDPPEYGLAGSWEGEPLKAF
jgi:hypothetical protein